LCAKIEQVDALRRDRAQRQRDRYQARVTKGVVIEAQERFMLHAAPFSSRRPATPSRSASGKPAAPRSARQLEFGNRAGDVLAIRSSCGWPARREMGANQARVELPGSGWVSDRPWAGCPGMDGLLTGVRQLGLPVTKFPKGCGQVFLPALGGAIVHWAACPDPCWISDRPRAALPQSSWRPA